MRTGETLEPTLTMSSSEPSSLSAAIEAKETELLRFLFGDLDFLGLVVVCLRGDGTTKGD